MDPRNYTLTVVEKSFSVTYTHEDIDRCDDFDDVFDIGDEMGVDLSGLDDLDDIKGRLKMHLDKESGNYKSRILNEIVQSNKEYSKKRHKLVELLKKCHDVLEKFEVKTVPSDITAKRGSAAIKDFLKTEGATKNLEIDFINRIRFVENGDCMVVVSGETSAGKSSFLNLLLGEIVLPVHHNPCTSVITRICYGDKRHAKILHKDGSEEMIEELAKNKLSEQLWSKIFETNVDQRDTASSILEVQLYLSSDILKSGIVLVDSPGIGENEAMDSVIANFVSENHIMGFIYLIKSDHAGGVDEDRLGNLLKVIIEKQKKRSDDHGTPFDPKCAIFVCNLWDNVKKAERDKVYDYAVRKLGYYWPGLVRSSVVQFSAKRAKEELSIDPDYITKDYRLFLDNMKELVNRAADRRVKSTYKWMETVLVRSVHHLKTIVKSVDNSDSELEDKMKAVHEKLQTLRMKSDIVLKNQREHIETAVKEIWQDFKNFLNQHATRFRLVQWLKTDLPEIHNNDGWPEVKEKIQNTILNRITDEFGKWEEENGKIKDIEKEIYTEIKAKLNILQGDLDAIENDLHSDSSSIESNEEYGRRPSLIDIRMGRKKSIDIQDLHIQALPIKLVSKFLHPLDAITTKVRQSVLYDIVVLQTKLAEFKREPLVVAKRVTEKFLDRFLNPAEGEVDQLLIFINEIMDRPKELLGMIEKNLPALMKSNEDLLDHIIHCRKNAKESREMYEQMMEGLEALKLHLLEYGSGYIYVDDFAGHQIRLYDEYNDYGQNERFIVSDLVLSCSTNDDTNRRRIPRGIWTALQNGSLFDEEEERDDPIVIKVYLPLSGVTETYAEVTKLRFLDHDCLARFLGIHHSDTQTPAFVYEDHLRSLKRYKNTTFLDQTEEIPRILKEVVMGIQYLHSRKLVHMELNVNTITVDFHGAVKLTGGCLPRCANFPMDKETISVGEFVYLSPDVLRGETYVACADIYSLGLLMFELLLDVRCFDNQRAMTLDRFTSKVDAIQMLEIDTKFKEAGVTESTKNLIKWCLGLADHRPTIQVLSDKVADFKNEPCISAIKRGGRSKYNRRGAVKRNSLK